ncbi:MAG: hypothetical protein DIU80_023170 [Chloroflexota bacterium]
MNLLHLFIARWLADLRRVAELYPAICTFGPPPAAGATAKGRRASSQRR